MLENEIIISIKLVMSTEGSMKCSKIYLSPGKMLLTMFLFQKWLGGPFPEDAWAWWLLMHWLQLQSTPCEALPSVWISFAWQYSQACGHPWCLCTFSYQMSSFQSTLHLICFDTALIEQPPLSVMTLCDLPSLWKVSMIVFWTIDMSIVFPIIVVSNNKRYPECILYGWSFIETQIFSFSPYSNFLRCTCLFLSVWPFLAGNKFNKRCRVTLQTLESLPSLTGEDRYSPVVIFKVISCTN